MNDIDSVGKGAEVKNNSCGVAEFDEADACFLWSNLKRVDNAGNEVQYIDLPVLKRGSDDIRWLVGNENDVVETNWKEKKIVAN